VTRYALRGDVTGELLSFGGLVLVHDNPAEMAFLVCGATPIELGRSFPADHTMPLRSHPDLANVRWPLRKADFKR
jgi:hypothetical protein